MFQLYQAGYLITLTADINGDGFNDLLVQNTPQTIIGYYGSAKGFDNRPDLNISVPPNARFYALDINLDGRDEIIVDPNSSESIQNMNESIVYFLETTH